MTTNDIPNLFDPLIAEATRKLFNLLMGKGEASSRRAWMEEKGHLVEADL